MQRVMKSAAKLQMVIPDAVLVGGTAAIIYARHRDSLDHDHVVADLAERYEMVLDAVEASEGWATSVRASRPPLTLLGSLDGVEAGLRQLRRSRPLETAEYVLPDGARLAVPTLREALRIKAYLVVQRNAVRDYLDVVGLADRAGIAFAAETLIGIDDYYLDRSESDDSVRTQLVLKLAKPAPHDPVVMNELHHYRGLAEKWHDWKSVEAVCHELALAVGQA